MIEQQNKRRFNELLEDVNLKISKLKPRDIKLKNEILKYPLISSAGALSLMVIIYWGLLASDRYVSEAHVIIQSTDLINTHNMDIGSLLGGVSSGGGADQMLLRDHLLSVDMLKELDKELNLRAHYSDSRWDIISRMWDKDTEIEWFYKYYLTRVSIEYDDVAGVLVIKAEAFDAKMAQAITTMLVKNGEKFMNTIAHQLAKVQVDFLEKAVVRMSDRVMHARKEELDYQNSKGLVSPENTTENLVGIVNGMQTRLSELQADKVAMLSYLVPNSPSVVEINMQIAAVKKQIRREKSRLTSPNGKTLNKMVEEYQRLQMNSQFSQDVYKSALVSLEQGRIDAARTLKKMSILQHPTLPEYPLQPERLYNIVVFILCTILIVGIISLLKAIILDHKD